MAATIRTLCWGCALAAFGQGQLSGAAAGQLSPRMTTKVDTALAFVGDPVTLTATVEHPSSSEVRWPHPDSLDVSPFEVLGSSQTSGERDGLRVSELSLTVAAYELGELDLPGVTAVVVSPGGVRDTLLGDGFLIEVASVGADEGGDIRDIRGPMYLPRAWWSGAVWIVAGVLLAAAALWWRVRGAKRTVGETNFRRPERPPEEIALRELERIADSGLLRRGMAKRYHIELSDALRRYVNARFGIDALEMTTRELAHELEGGERDPDWVQGLARVLARCDLVKFAKDRPDPGRSSETMAMGKELVLAVLAARRAARVAAEQAAVAEAAVAEPAKEEPD